VSNEAKNNKDVPSPHIHQHRFGRPRQPLFLWSVLLSFVVAGIEWAMVQQRLSLVLARLSSDKSIQTVTLHINVTLQYKTIKDAY
jgi:hypothetical protein